jgi:hypothetical protein
MGILRRLPEPRLPHFDAEEVNRSAEAYRWLETPDAFLGLGSYVATMTLAAIGGPDRAGKRPWIPLALAAKVGLDAVLASFQVLMQARKLHTYCSWCLLSSAATFGSLPLVVREARAALKCLLCKESGASASRWCPRRLYERQGLARTAKGWTPRSAAVFAHGVGSGDCSAGKGARAA